MIEQGSYMLLSRAIIILWCSLMVIVSGLLIAEYRFFKEQAQQISILKGDYAVSLKKLKCNYLKEQQEDSLRSDSKKKVAINDESESQFLVVNREPAYLKKSALSFARRHNLEKDIKKLYESDNAKTHSIVTYKKVSLIAKRKLSKKRKSSENNSLRSYRALQREPLFCWPIDRSKFWLSSVFGPRKGPKGWKMHRGIDMAAPRGTLVKAAGAGVIVQASYSSGYGNTIVISHNDKFKTRYAHLDKILVLQGKQVKKGEVIGKVGATGHVRKSKWAQDGSHLHFEVCVGDRQVNPFYFLE